METTRSLLNKIHHTNKKNLCVICFGIVYLVWNYTAFIRFGGVQELFDAGYSTLDASWVVGLNWASQLHLKWAADSLVLTYGPLYFLDGFLLPEFHNSQTLLIVNIGMNLLFVSCFSYVFYLLSNLYSGSKTRWLVVIIAALLLAQKPNISLLPIFVAFISLPIIFQKNVSGGKSDIGIRYIRYTIISLTLALMPFIKFSHIYESIVLVVILALFLSYRSKFFDAALMCSLFVVFSVLIWVLATGEEASSYLPYLLTRFIVSSGYTEAMMLDFIRPIDFLAFILALSYLAALGLILLFFLFTRKMNWMTAWLLPLIPLFLGFKNSFVRADEHASIFLGYVFLSALYYYYQIKYRQYEEIDLPSRQILASIFVPFLAIIVCSSCSLLGVKLDIKNDLFVIPKLLGSDPGGSMSQETIRATYGLEPEFLSQIDKKKTTDIIPWDIALLYGYDLDWMPRPVIQSYVSYMSELDALDAEFFRKSNSPKQLIVSLSTIDQRYAIFDTPATFQVLLDGYEYVSQSSNGRFALFRKKREPIFRDSVLIDQSEHNFSEEILIPKEQQGHVFMSVEIEPTFVGKLFDVFYKSTPLFIEVTPENGEQRRYRYVRETGKNGLFVSKYVENLNDLEMVFSEDYDQNITSVRLYGDSVMYNEPFNVHFYEIPFR